MPRWAVEEQYYEMPELVGFQTMVILDPNGMNFDVVSWDWFWLLFKSGSSYCGLTFLSTLEKVKITLEQIFLTVGQNKYGNKIPFSNFSCMFLNPNKFFKFEL